MKSTTTHPVLAGKFKCLFVLFFLSFFLSSVIEANADPDAKPIELTHGKLPKIKLPRLFKIGKPYIRRINIPASAKNIPQKIRENSRKLRRGYKKYMKNVKKFVRMPYPIFKGWCDRFFLYCTVLSSK